MTDLKSSQQPPVTSGKAARIAYAAIAILALSASILSVYLGLRGMLTRDWNELLQQHGPAVLGIPLATGVATVLVSALRALDGPFRVDFLGLKVEGAAALVAAWVLAFIAVAAMIRWLW